MRMAGQWSKSIPGYRAKIAAWCTPALAHAPHAGALSIVLADDAFVHALNRSYRGKDRPTNVLAFPGGAEELGDVILAYETVKREAAAQGKGFARHAAHLVVHGCLHLSGHDHEREDGRAAMEAIEIGILADLGFPNPYESVR